MNETEIEKLEGIALLRAFHKAFYTRLLGDDCDPLVVIDDIGNILVFRQDDLEEPNIYVMSMAKQLVHVMHSLQIFNPQFETTEDNEKVYCTLAGSQALGDDYFEAVMRAYLLFKARREKNPKQ